MTITLPPLPRPTVSLEMPPKFVSRNAPALTLTSPALPSPRASLDIVPPLMMDRLAPATLTLPALPLLTLSASVVIPPEVGIGLDPVDRQRAGDIDRKAAGIARPERAARNLTVGDDLQGPGLDRDIAGVAGA